MESGPAITDAKTRQRERLTSWSFEEVAHALISCKHLCCREGVDRAPKPPKNSFVPASSILDASRMTQGSMNRHLPVRKTPLTNRATKIGLASDIEELDLAGLSSDPSGISKSGPRESQRPQQLDYTVYTGRSNPVVPRGNPSTDYGKGEQLTLSLANTVKAAGSSDRPSTDYDDDWLSGLASPSTSLTKGKQAIESCPKQGPNGHSSIWEDGPPRLSKFKFPSEVHNETNIDSDDLEGFHLSQFSNELSDVEVAMIGLSDSVTIQEDLQNRAAYDCSTATHARENKDDELYQDDASSPRLFGPSKIHAERSRRFNATSRHEKPCLPTDSPENVSILAEKRTADASVAVEESSRQEPAPKRQRTSGHGDQALHPTSSAEDKAGITPPVIKPGQPAWVYDFDPAFIAEYQDIVDFV